MLFSIRDDLVVRWLVILPIFISMAISARLWCVRETKVIGSIHVDTALQCQNFVGS